MRTLFALAALLLAAVAIAAASAGLKWDAVLTYDDGSAFPTDQKVVYLVYDSAGKQVASTFVPTVTAAQLPSDGCYSISAAMYSAAINGIVPASESKPAPPYCLKPPPPPQKRLATPTGVGQL